MPTLTSKRARICLRAKPVRLEAKTREFEMVAYTGAEVDLGFFDRDPWIFDIEGIELGERVPILRDHDPSRVVGHGAASRGEVGVLASGVVIDSEHFPDALAVAAASDAEFPWQASVGLETLETEYLGEGATATVNGREVVGPITIARKSRLFEVSFVPLGADSSTSARVLNDRGGYLMEEEHNEDDAPEVTMASVASFLGMTEEEVKGLMEPAEDSVEEELEEVEASIALSQVAALAEAFPDDAAHALQAARKGQTVEAAKAAYTDVLLARTKSLSNQLAAAQKQLAKQPSGAKALRMTDGGTPKRVDGETDGERNHRLAKAYQAKHGVSYRAARKHIEKEVA